MLFQQRESGTKKTKRSKPMPRQQRERGPMKKRS
jgi:hypothetical protein